VLLEPLQRLVEIVMYSLMDRISFAQKVVVVEQLRLLEPEDKYPLVLVTAAVQVVMDTDTTWPVQVAVVLVDIVETAAAQPHQPLLGLVVVVVAVVVIATTILTEVTQAVAVGLAFTEKGLAVLPEPTTLRPTRAVKADQVVMMVKLSSTHPMALVMVVYMAVVVEQLGMMIMEMEHQQ